MADKLTKASQGYFSAKREMVEAIDRRIEKADEARQKAVLEGAAQDHQIADACVKTLENVRYFVRNVMLWDTSKGD